MFKKVIGLSTIAITFVSSLVTAHADSTNRPVVRLNVYNEGTDALHSATTTCRGVVYASRNIPAGQVGYMEVHAKDVNYLNCSVTYQFGTKYCTWTFTRYGVWYWGGSPRWTDPSISWSGYGCSATVTSTHFNNGDFDGDLYVRSR